jgi:eukaryotic-like serine/threonine-protein kinase
MGAVYLADDTRLQRRVALKILHETLISSDEAKRRVMREARAAAALDHPNICAIFEAGEAEGHSYIAMQYVEGETLASRLRRGRLAAAEGLGIATEVVGALTEAHEHGVVHRDIKPQNILISTRGQAKVLDFGIARHIAVPGATQLTVSGTTPGLLVGTAAYMSPEQARAEPLDGRSDIFSFGIVLCEILTGRHPFERPTGADTLAAIVTAQPQVDAVGGVLGGELERIIRKCLEKDRDLRYQSSADLLADLRRLSRTAPASASSRMSWRSPRVRAAAGICALLVALAAAETYRRSAATGPTLRSVAVLPFVNVDIGPDLDYQVDGITDGLIAGLSRLPDLTVISHSAVFSYRGRDVDPRTAASVLGVEAVITGRVFRSSDAITVSVELVDGRDNRRLWGEQYRRRPGELSEGQDQIQGEISRELRPAFRPAAAQVGTNSEAYQLYLQGRFFWHLWTQDGARRAVEFFQQAIALDPAFAPAYSGIAEAHVVPGTGLPQREAYRLAREAAEKALALDPTLSEARASLASVLLTQDWDFGGAEREFRRALELNPNNIEAHHQFSHFLITIGRVDEAASEMRKVVELDPTSLLPIAHLAYYHTFTRQYDDAIRYHLRYLDGYPNEPSTHMQLAQAYKGKGMEAEAFESYLRFHTMNRWPPADLEALKAAFAAEGLRGYFRIRIRQLEQKGEPEPHAFPIQSLGSQIAALYAQLGDRDRAFAWLEKDFAERGDGIVHLREEIAFDNLRSDPRFADLLKRIGLPPL